VERVPPPKSMARDLATAEPVAAKIVHCRIVTEPRSPLMRWATSLVGKMVSAGSMSKGVERVESEKSWNETVGSSAALTGFSGGTGTGSQGNQRPRRSTKSNHEDVEAAVGRTTRLTLSHVYSPP
jgi:hypothetical protein